MIFITGSTGFIGLNLVNQLVKKKYQVTCFVRKSSDISKLSKLNVKIIYGDITDKESISKAISNQKIIIHLAALTSEFSDKYGSSRLINVFGTKNLLDICKERKVNRIIVLSSESTKREIKGNYAKTKYEVDELVKNSGLDFTILRPSIVYGEGSGGLFKKTLNYIKILPIIPIIGSGEQRITPIHVDDVVKAIISAIDLEITKNKEYDLPGPDKITFNNFIDNVLEILQIKKRKVHIPFFLVFYCIKFLSLFLKNPPLTSDNLLGLKQEISMSSDEANKDFNFVASSFRDGLKKTFYGDYLDKKKVAVIGMGKMGILHSSIINKIPEAQLVAICDINPKINNQLKTIGFNVPFFISINEMLKNINLDAAFICVPPFLNHIISKEFLDKGISLFIEKPMSNTLFNANHMLNNYLKNKNKLITSCGYMFAYHSVFVNLGNLIKNKNFGSVISFDSYCYISQVFKQKNNSNWQYDQKRTGGGVLITMTSHLLFLLNLYFGECFAVKGSINSFFTKMDDEVSVDLKFKNVTGKIKTSWCVKGYENLSIGIKINTEKAVIDATNNLIEIKFKSGKTEKIHISEIDDNSEFELGGKGYYNQDRDFINCLNTKKEPITNWKKAFETQKIIEAIYISVKENKWIDLRKMI